MTREKHGSAPLGVALAEKDGVFSLSSQMLTLTANRLEDSIADVRDDSLLALKEQLGKGLRNALSCAPEEVISAIQSESAADPYRKAYLLGQVGMAHTVAARATTRRISDDFEEVLASTSLWPYVAALIEKPLTNSELAVAVDERVETVCRKLRKLRELGATDFRREGQVVQNFLTPPARAMAEAISRTKSMLPKPKSELSQFIADKILALEPYMNEHQNFSTGFHQAVGAR